MESLLAKHLLVTKIGDETIVFDPHTNRAHHLDARASELLRTESEEVAGAEDPLKSYTLSLLEKEHLVDRPIPAGMNRRQVLAALGKGVALPVITTLALPAPAAAASTPVTEQECEMSGGTACMRLCTGPFPFGERVCGSLTFDVGGPCGCVVAPAVCGCTTT